MTPFVFKSPALSQLTGKLASQKIAAKLCKEEVWRLTKIKSPQMLDETATRYSEPTSSFPVFKTTPETYSIKNDDQYEEVEAARKKELLDRTLAGEPLEETASTDDLLQKAHKQWAAHEQAIEYLERQIEREKSRLATEYSVSVKPIHDKLMRNLLDKMTDMHVAWTEVYALKRHLLDSGVCLRGLCLTVPEEFLSTPVNPFGPVANFFREAKRQGYCKEVPVELRG